MVWLQGLRIRSANVVSSSPEAGRLQTRKELTFPLESDGRKRLMFELQATRQEEFLISESCLNKISETGCLKQQKLIFLEFWSLEVQDQGSSVVCFRRCLFSVLQTAAFLLCPHKVKRARASSLGSLHIEAGILA